MNRTSRGIGAAVLVAALAAGAGPVSAQGVRGRLRLDASFVQFRGVMRVSVPESLAVGDQVTRLLEDGTVVTCEPGGDCYYYRAGGLLHAGPVTQDLSLTAWSRLPGLSATVQMRGRYGSDALWPRSSQRFQALAAYVNFERSGYRLRAGRQSRGSGLGFDYFDGASLLWRSLGNVRVEGFAGRSLSGNLDQTATGDLLAEADALAPDRPSVLLGLESKARWGRRFAGSLLYQREIRTDRAGLYSERMALDARLATRPATVSLAGTYDVASGEFNEAKLRLERSVTREVFASVEARHYKPFFELWTIWGVFSPVAYNEGRARASWRASPELTADVEGSYRNYDDAHREVNAAPVEGDGWRGRVGASWSRDAWSAAASVGVFKGYGAYRSLLQASGGRSFPGRGYLGLYGSGTQQFSEFRFGEGTSRGIGLEGRLGVGRADLDGSLAVYRQTFDNRPGFSDYNQVRGRLGITVGFGTEAGGTRAGAGDYGATPARRGREEGES